MDKEIDFRKSCAELIKNISENSRVHELKFNGDGFNKLVEFLLKIKPESKTRAHKANLIEFLETLDAKLRNEKIDEMEYLRLKREKLDPILYYLQSYHGVYEGVYIIPTFGVVGVLIDIVLSLFGVAGYYYHIPVFMLLFLFIGKAMHYWHNKKGKLLNL